MTTKEILLSFAENEGQAEQVFDLLDTAMWDEWDVGLASGMELGFGGPEITIAASTAVHFVD